MESLNTGGLIIISGGVGGGGGWGGGGLMQCWWDIFFIRRPVELFFKWFFHTLMPYSKIRFQCSLLIIS